MTSRTPSHRRTPPDISIKPRRMDFDIPDDVPRHWHGGDPVKTHFLNAFSCLLPAYERFFVAVIGRNKARIKDPALAAEAHAFCRQEGLHAAEHVKYNRMLVNQGYRAFPALERLQTALLAVVQKIFSDGMLLAMAAGGEHMTSYMGHEFLSRPEKWSEGCHPAMSALWSWHAMEETEHKAVCFDVYQELCGRRWLRCSALILECLQFFAATAAIHLYMLAVDFLFFKPPSMKSYAGFLWGRDGFFRGAVEECAKYLKKDFHPWQNDNRHLIKPFLKSLPG
ncbi:MAG: metal-dependent hydrolase [Elusimicrobiota bacterium]